MDDRIGYVLKQAQQALRTAMDDALRRHGLTTPQYAALDAVGASGAISGAELARRSFVTPQTMNGIIANLLAAGLVERHVNPADTRVLRVSLTPTGQRRLEACQHEIDAIQERMVSGLGPDEQRWLIETLRRCAETLTVSFGEGPGSM